MSPPDIAASVRRDEYTGGNRCHPCTILNVAIAVAVAGVVAWTGYLLVATVALVAGLAAIYLRGYLVPGTPTITRRYLPETVLRVFGKEPAPRNPGRPNAADRPDVVDDLFADGVLAGGRSGAEPRLDTRFRGAWRDRIGTVRGRDLGPENVTEVLDAAKCTAQGECSFVVDGDKLIRWESEAAFVADVAAAATLSTRSDRWTRLDREERLNVLAGLRLFLERCPACNASLSRVEQRIDSCCQPPYTVVRSVCEECGSIVADVSVPKPDEESPTRLQFLDSS